MIEILKQIEVATRNRVDDQTLIRATMVTIDEWERRPIRRVINFLRKIWRMKWMLDMWRVIGD